MNVNCRICGKVGYDPGNFNTIGDPSDSPFVYVFYRPNPHRVLGICNRCCARFRSFCSLYKYNGPIHREEDARSFLNKIGPLITQAANEWLVKELNRAAKKQKDSNA